MKKLLSPLLFLAVCISLSGQNITGPWTGTLDVKVQQLTLTFNISETQEGFTCTLDSPDEGVNGVPAKIAFDGLSVNIEIPSIAAIFKGINTGKMISGSFLQNGQNFPLALKPGKPTVSRPQEPLPPFPYDSEEVCFRNGEVELHGTLTLPENKDLTIVMVTGSGAQNRNEELFNHKPFLVISDHLAKAGISTLRYDDRGVGESTGDKNTVTIESNTADALCAVEYLRKRGFGRIGVLGHSEGGTIAFILASEGKVDFIISLAGAAVDGETILTDQTITTLKQSGYTEDQIKQILTQMPVRMQASRNPWLDSFVKYNPAEAISKISCPVLALNGSKDYQVRASVNLPSIRSNIPEGTAIKIIEYDGLNHLFQHCETGIALEYNKIEETIAPEVLDDILEWIQVTMHE